ncbi:peptidoglycan-binding protein, partial [uncultured Enterovirga sp.]|uniref:peptidoglycan-binding protein n=1 Tax=uncultured Enterovirga sp. TaxID=2026352 RepID=UPI0035CAD2B9
MILSRRAFLSTSAAAAVSATAFGPGAQADQAEWAQNYDGAARVRVPRSNTPILSREALASTEEMVERYRDIVLRGGWQNLQAPGGMKVGTKSPAVLALRQRLIVEGDLDPSAGSSATYDSYVEAGVRRFQSRNGLSTVGTLNSATVAAMNIPAETRMRQLELNAVRLRSYSGDLGRRFVIVNIPAALVETVEDGRVVTRHAAGVGKIDRQSPIMNAKITQV